MQPSTTASSPCITRRDTTPEALELAISGPSHRHGSIQLIVFLANLDFDLRPIALTEPQLKPSTDIASRIEPASPIHPANSFTDASTREWRRRLTIPLGLLPWGLPIHSARPRPWPWPRARHPLARQPPPPSTPPRRSVHLQSPVPLARLLQRSHLHLARLPRPPSPPKDSIDSHRLTPLERPSHKPRPAADSQQHRKVLPRARRPSHLSLDHSVRRAQSSLRMRIQ